MQHPCNSPCNSPCNTLHPLQVLPVIDAERSLALRAFGEDWPKKLNVTMCLADGPPARISALNTSLRSYRPGYLHVWRLKTFWDERVISEEDVTSLASN